MDLDTLLNRLEYERGGEHEYAEVMLMSPGGRRYDVLSLNWDEDRRQWILIGERPDHD